MAKVVQRRRGSTAEHSAFTGALAETTIDTTKNTVVVHDGTTVGGHPLALESLVNTHTSDLPTLTGSNTEATDTFLVYDASAGVMKSITREELNNAMEQDALANVDITSGTINGITELSVIGNITESTDGGTTYYNVVTQQDIGTEPNEIPLNQYLGSMAYQNLESVTIEDLEISGTISGGAIDDVVIGGVTPAPGTFTTLNVNGATTIDGDLTVNGNTTTISTTELVVEDKNITIANGAADAAAADGAGITVDGANAQLTYVATGDKWVMNKPLDLGSNALTSSSVDINGGTIDSTPIGDSTPSTGAFTDLEYTGTLTGSAGIINIGSGQIYKDASGNVGIGTSSPDSSDWNSNSKLLHIQQNTTDGAILKLESTNTTGIFAAGNGQLQIGTIEPYPLKFYTNFAERLRIDASGNVGIGTSTPAVNLEVRSTTQSIMRIRSDAGSITDFGSDETGTYWRNYSPSKDTFRWLLDDGSEAMRINSSGNVGIGTSSPNAQLEVSRTATNAYSAMRWTNTGASGRIYEIGLGGDTSATDYANKLYFRDSTASSNRMVIDSSGNVGIGTSSPPLSSRLAISGGAINFIDTAGRDILWGTSSYVYITGNQGTGVLAMGTNSTERVRIDSAGNVGIGTSAPFGKLDVLVGNDDRLIFTTLGTAPVIRAVNAANSAYDSLQLEGSDIRFFESGSETMRLDASGNLGIGTTAPAAKLQVEDVGIDTTSTLITTTTQTTVCSYSATSFRTAELICQIVDTTNLHYHSVKFFVIHDDTNVWFSQTNVIHSHDELGTFTADISGGNVRLLFTPSEATNKTVKVVATTVTV